MIATPVIGHDGVEGRALSHIANTAPSYLDYRPSRTRQMVRLPFSQKREAAVFGKNRRLPRAEMKLTTACSPVARITLITWIQT